MTPAAGPERAGGADGAGTRPEHEPRRLPAMLRGRVEVRDFLLVTYAVPVERLHGQLHGDLHPDLHPETVTDAQGRQRALVSATCFRNDRLRWAGGPGPTHDFHQSTFRSYVVHRRRGAGALFLASATSTVPSTIGQRLGLRDTRRGRFTVHTERTGDAGYARYAATIEQPVGVDELVAVATEPARAVPPFRSGREHVRFLTHRLHGYAVSLPGVWVDAPVLHREMAAFQGQLVRARLPSLDRLGLVGEAEWSRPFSVLVAPGATFDLLPPVPLSDGRAARTPTRGAGRR